MYWLKTIISESFHVRLHRRCLFYIRVTSPQVCSRHKPQNSGPTNIVLITDTLITLEWRRIFTPSCHKHELLAPAYATLTVHPRGTSLFSGQAREAVELHLRICFPYASTRSRYSFFRLKHTIMKVIYQYQNHASDQYLRKTTQCLALRNESSHVYRNPNTLIVMFIIGIYCTLPESRSMQSAARTFLLSSPS